MRAVILKKKIKFTVIVQCVSLREKKPAVAAMLESKAHISIFSERNGG